LNWQGYKSSQPVRIRNQASEHIQNDVYGEMALTLAPIYFDERFLHLRNSDQEHLLLTLAQLMEASIGQPDAGLWEFRGGWQEHSFTNLMCWAGLERVTRMVSKGHLSGLRQNPLTSRDHAMSALMRGAHNGTLRNGPSDPSFDASLAILPIVGFPDQKLCMDTLRGIQHELALGKQRPESSFFYRYSRKDDFGTPQSAFVICSFWMAQALAKLGNYQEAKSIFEDALTASNKLGLFSEHFDPHQQQQLGNFPQAYSHVGLINAAFAISPNWSEVL
jgi:GH15 family glucan-1,4-alpha-glucosidase